MLEQNPPFVSFVFGRIRPPSFVLLKGQIKEKLSVNKTMTGTPKVLHFSYMQQELLCRFRRTSSLALNNFQTMVEFHRSTSAAFTFFKGNLRTTIL